MIAFVVCLNFALALVIAKVSRSLNELKTNMLFGAFVANIIVNMFVLFACGLQFDLNNVLMATSICCAAAGTWLGYLIAGIVFVK